MLEAAIDAGCNSLIALETSLARVDGIPGHHEQAETSIQAAIDLVRSAVSELQRLNPLRAGNPLALGFVRSGASRRSRASQRRSPPERDC